MKKVVFLGLLFATFALTACKKDYICECQKIPPNGEKIITQTDIPKSSKRDAQSVCDFQETSYQDNGDTFKANCKLL